MPSVKPTGASDARAARLPPDEIWRACLLIVASLLLGLVTMIPGIAPERPAEADMPALEVLGLLAVFGGLTLLLALKILQRRNWARWAMLAYLVLGWLLAAATMKEDFALSPLAGLINLVCMVLEWLAVWQLFFGNGPKWFEGRATSARS